MDGTPPSIDSQSAPPPEKIDYHAEYRERFAKAKTEAEAKGLKYEHPDKAGIGWKLHLEVSNASISDPLVIKISDFLNSRRLKFKTGSSAYEAVTVYIGDRDTTDDLAEELERLFGNDLKDPNEDVQIYDMQFAGRVWGRFEIENDTIRNPRLRDFWPTKYQYYGDSGVPLLDKVVLRDRTDDRAKSIEALTQDYGAFFTGTRGNPI